MSRKACLVANPGVSVPERGLSCEFRLRVPGPGLELGVRLPPELLVGTVSDLDVPDFRRVELSVLCVLCRAADAASANCFVSSLTGRGSLAGRSEPATSVPRGRTTSSVEK
mmetsp:Transcript_83050/g.220344  ORF Transcript_83050/g.220344 Transcript_83050/m.220344 type:complete len:111 (+) Transcript_83050:113-445(+)